ncbi:hypothetical protein ACSSV1_000846 [Labrenzia sp. MBR-25]
MRDLTDEIEEAQAKVAHLRIRAERSSARLEDEFALEKARNRLLTLELRNLKQAATRAAVPATSPECGAPAALEGKGKPFLSQEQKVNKCRVRRGRGQKPHLRPCRALRW